MDVNDKFNLIKKVGEEIITEDDLKKLLKEKKNIVAYDGFEPSGRIHIAQAILRSININKMTKEQLLSPFVLGGMSLKNRVVLAPMTRARAGKERIPNNLMAEYYVQRANAGLLITEATSILET